MNHTLRRFERTLKTQVNYQQPQKKKFYWK